MHDYRLLGGTVGSAGHLIYEVPPLPNPLNPWRTIATDVFNAEKGIYEDMQPTVNTWQSILEGAINDMWLLRHNHPLGSNDSTGWGNLRTAEELTDNYERVTEETKERMLEVPKYGVMPAFRGIGSKSMYRSKNWWANARARFVRFQLENIERQLEYRPKLKSGTANISYDVSWSDEEFGEIIPRNLGKQLLVKELAQVMSKGFTKEYAGRLHHFVFIFRWGFLDEIWCPREFWELRAPFLIGYQFEEQRTIEIGGKSVVALFRGNELAKQPIRIVRYVDDKGNPGNPIEVDRSPWTVDCDYGIGAFTKSLAMTSIQNHSSIPFNE